MKGFRVKGRTLHGTAADDARWLATTPEEGAELATTQARTLVKFCGITRQADAWLAADVGAAAVGFVFWRGSPRAVTPDEVKEIVRTLPAFMRKVGVFVNAPVAEIEAITAHTGIDVVQLHGEESPGCLPASPARIVKAVGRDGEDLLEQARAWPAGVLLLVDAIHGERRGGTGRHADWPAAAALQRERPIMLAGGLTPECVGEAVTLVRPYAVDVASGVEMRPGVKDPERMRAFQRAVEQAWM
jgi:phosphoribosylanthranilate isomerase